MMDQVEQHSIMMRVAELLSSVLVSIIQTYCNSMFGNVENILDYLSNVPE